MFILVTVVATPRRLLGRGLATWESVQSLPVFFVIAFGGHLSSKGDP